MFDNRKQLGRIMVQWKQPRKLLWKKHQKQILNSVSIQVLFVGAVVTYCIYTNNTRPFFIMAMSALIWGAIYAFAPIYELRENGIRYEGGTERVHIFWRDIKSYSFKQPENGLGAISFELKKTWKFAPTFFYDMNKVDTSRLQDILREKLPGRETNITDAGSLLNELEEILSAKT